MATNAGKDAVLKAGASATPTDEVGGIESFSFSRSATHHDNTDFSDGDFEKVVQGVKDVAGEVSGYYDEGDGQQAIRNSIDTDADLHVQALPDGTNGREYQMNTASYSISIDQDGRVDFSASLVLNDTTAGSNVGSP